MFGQLLMDAVVYRKYPSSAAAEHAFMCSLCDKTAGEVKVYGSADDCFLHVSSFLSHNKGIAAEGFAYLQNIISSGDLHALYAYDFELVPFFCPECDGVFCGAHWKYWDEIEEDGWRDSTRGRCPRGHQRMLDD